MSQNRLNNVQMILKINVQIGTRAASVCVCVCVCVIECAGFY